MRLLKVRGDTCKGREFPDPVFYKFHHFRETIMKKLKIAHQLFALVGVLMAAFAVATYFQIRTTSQS
ncbi:hypothetical protein, partial [Bacillus sp. SIMBA_033]|uniref:hypothetical protein n=1 Tax=Bacillus sp. SIMBA_033 TaxID=3085776 RepID=UPI00397859B7